MALAQACDVAACDGASPFSAWVSALGGLGSVQGDGNASTLTYNVGGAAAGIDYRFDPRFLVGLGVGYTHGTQWVNSFMGQGWTDTRQRRGLRLVHARRGFYVDALAGYAYFNNQLQRQIQIPGLQPRTANGSTGANQFLGQVETGYKLGIYAPAHGDRSRRSPACRPERRRRTPSPRMGRNSLSLNVAQQTTNSLRTVLGADLAGAIAARQRARAGPQRCGWAGSMSTPTPAGRSRRRSPARRRHRSPSMAPRRQRDAAIVGFSASDQHRGSHAALPALRRRAGTGTDNHALTAGLRMSW